MNTNKTRKAFTSTKAAAVGPYSHAVESSGLVFLSGQTPLDPKTGSLVVGSITEQTRQVFKNLESVLEAAGLTFDAVVKTTVFLTDLSNFKEMNETYQEYFTPPYPARSTIGVSQLPLGAEIEIELIAQKNSN